METRGQCDVTDSNLIYDVGAHRGEDTQFYLKKGFRVVAIEANPALHQALAERFRPQIVSGQLTLLGCAIARTEGEIDFYVNEKMSVWGTTDPAWALRNLKLGAPSRRVQVKAQRFENILARHGVPHYLKIDIEGADMLCVEALQGMDRVPQFLSIESDKRRWGSLLREFSVMASLGYRKFKVIDQRRIARQSPPYPAREGHYAASQFAYGSSGLFGDELPGEWLSKEDAISAYRFIFLHYRWFGDGTFGGRVVGKVPLVRRLLLPGWYDTHASL